VLREQACQASSQVGVCAGPQAVVDVGHNGGTPGYEAQLDIYLERRQTAIFLSNLDRGVMPVLRQSQELLTGRR
jgi:hypothetical protein